MSHICVHLATRARKRSEELFVTIASNSTRRLLWQAAAIAKIPNGRRGSVLRFNTLHEAAYMQRASSYDFASELHACTIRRRSSRRTCYAQLRVRRLYMRRQRIVTPRRARRPS